MIAVTHNSSFESDPRSRWAKLSIPSATHHPQKAHAESIGATVYRLRTRYRQIALRKKIALGRRCHHVAFGSKADILTISARCPLWARSRRSSHPPIAFARSHCAVPAMQWPEKKNRPATRQSPTPTPFPSAPGVGGTRPKIAVGMPTDGGSDDTDALMPPLRVRVRKEWKDPR